MASMNVFDADAFSITSMAAAVDKVGYVPGFLGSLPGLFDPVPVRTPDIWIEDRGPTEPALIQTSPRGSIPTRQGPETRNARGFKTVRIATGDRIYADQIAGVRGFGTESDLQAMQVEVARRQFLLRRNMELTMENLRLGAVQGIVTDADASTIINWSTELSQAIPAEVDFDLDNASPVEGAIRKKCNTLRRSIVRALKGLGGEDIAIYGLCGDAFWDDLTSNPEIIKTYLNQQSANELRGPYGKVWSMFRYGEINWINYRSTDDGSTVAINTDKCKFFPAGAGIFKWAMAPAERFEFVNTLGQPVYSWIVRDTQRDMWADVEMYSYPLPVCTMPSALYQGRRT